MFRKLAEFLARRQRRRLRDYFAAHAPASVIDPPSLDYICENYHLTRDQGRAYLAYCWADLMLAAREVASDFPKHE